MKLICRELDHRTEYLIIQPWIWNLWGENILRL